MEQREEWMTELMCQMQKKCVRVLEIEQLTKELGDSLARGDRESAQLLLEMRQDEMNKADVIERDINILLESADMKTALEMNALLNDQKEFSDGEIGFEEKKIKELSNQIRNSLERTISIDKINSQKLAGKDSYYSK